MYTITQLEDGTFWCEGRLQDGTERWSEASLDAAIKSMKTFAKVMNGTKIKKKDIEFYRREPVNQPTYKYVQFKP